MLLAAPQRRRLRAGRRRRRERLHRPEQVAEHALRRPAQQRDRPAGPAHPYQLVRRSLVVRREHHADRRHDDVVGLVLEGQVLGVGLDPVDVETVSLGAFRARCQQIGRQVAGRHAGAALGGRDGRIARARRHVEHAQAGADPGRIREPLPDGQQEGVHHQGVVALPPHRPVLRLELDVRSIVCHCWSSHRDFRLLGRRACSADPSGTSGELPIFERPTHRTPRPNAAGTTARTVVMTCRPTSVARRSLMGPERTGCHGLSERLRSATKSF